MATIGYLLILISFLNILRNFNKFIIVLINLELLLIAISLLFLSQSLFFDDLEGYLTTLFLLVISAAEASIGLTLLVFYQSSFHSLNNR